MPCQDYKITEVDGAKYADEINRFNGLFPDDFWPLKPKHFTRGYWWLVHHDAHLIGFAGMVPFDPFPCVGYTKRQAILPGHRGKGLQRQLIEVSESRARASTDWTHLVSECSVDNVASANNHFRAGFKLCEAERPWEKETLFWIKPLRETT
jgi:GNAT superfamily N-acetyltransferase